MPVLSWSTFCKSPEPGAFSIRLAESPGLEDVQARDQLWGVHTRLYFMDDGI